MNITKRDVKNHIEMFNRWCYYCKNVEAVSFINYVLFKDYAVNSLFEFDGVGIA